ncbi:MAG TPA: pyruvate kinase [Desulfobulbus sp.]|nr:pyruvate kinase [Desulfobulbus sp.]
MTTLPLHKTKIVCTIGPASDTVEILSRMIQAGMNIARLNFSHGSFSTHARTIENIRAAADQTGKRVGIMADLPGPKIRIGHFAEEPITLHRGDSFTLSADDIIGDNHRVSITLTTLPQAVHPGDILFLADGLIQLKVERIYGADIICTVVAGGELRSKKGLNIPGIDLGISAFTKRDREYLQFALEHGVEAVSQSFVNTAADIIEVREAARAMGYEPFILAKIERAHARDNIDEILAVSDGIMIARGDLGVEIPIEQIAVAQKFITRRANLHGKPVITATQMLMSMTHNRRPTRAEATDVANAILDGTDCVMLSEESAMGDYPVESVQMLAKIAEATEPTIPADHFEQASKCTPVPSPRSTSTIVDSLSTSVESIISRLQTIAAVLAPTASGHTARSLSRFRLPTWILGVSRSERTCRALLFSYGVWPVVEPDHPDDWTDIAQGYAQEFSLAGTYIIQTEGPSPAHPQANHKLEIIPLTDKESVASPLENKEIP